MVPRPGRAKVLHTPYTAVNRAPRQAETTAWGLWEDRTPLCSSRITSIESSIATCIKEKSDCSHGTVGADEGIKLCSLLQIFQDFSY